MTSEAPTVVGLDPGFALTGVAVLRRDGDLVRCEHLEVIETKKTPKKLMRHLRVSADDYQLVRQIHFAIQKVITEYQPVAVAYEVYQPFTGKVKGRQGLRSASW